ncbi:hypothetical protein ABMA28_005954 [Loxostege sticticalis]|uniref:Reverse transcriptase domain-containing protein n=1 Tax=Loxostege sticticalis TaxID=481309 RepID=A0ABD0SNF9_LOXSC
MEDVRTAVKLMNRDCFMANLDLKEAYFLVLINEHDRKFLRFCFNGTLFEFSALPFGLCTAPCIFTKLLKPVMATLRSRGFLSVNYLDDILCLGDSYSSCLQNISETINLLTELGFIINFEKSVLIPSKVCQFLGFVLNSRHMRLELPDRKKQGILDQTRVLMHQTRISVRDFARYVGTLTAACPAVRYGWAHTKAFERVKYLSLLNNPSYERVISLPDNIQGDLIWWQDNILKIHNPIRISNYTLEIFTDASKTGWGASCRDEKIGGFWTDEERLHHINYLELLAAFFGLKSFANNLDSCEILMRIDNTTAISYINRMGGVQFTHLNDITQAIWKWCEDKNIFIFASYIRSCENTDADAESRNLNIDTEWELSSDAFREIVSKFGNPEIDLFASRINTKCEKYISWKRDPYALNIDAFTINWHDFFFYAFPPFSLVLKVLQKIKADKATDFLSNCFQNGSSYGTLNNHRSAISLISLNSIGSDDRIKRFFKGVFKLRPSYPRYTVTWDPIIVLDFLANFYPNDTLSLEVLTKKLVVPLALATGHRTQTLSLIRIKNIQRFNDRIIINITDLIKTSSVGRSQPILDLPFFTERPSICPAKTLTTYMDISSNHRPANEEKLILTYKRPYHAATSQTLGRWIKQTIEANIFRSHSTRHAATSAACRAGISVDAIRKAAGWSQQSAVFANFYNRPVDIASDSNFMEGVFRR